MPLVTALDPAAPPVPDSFAGSKIAQALADVPGAEHIADAWHGDPLCVVVFLPADDWRASAVLEVWPWLPGAGCDVTVVPRYIATTLYWYSSDDTVDYEQVEHPHAVATLVAALSPLIEAGHLGFDDLISQANAMLAVHAPADPDQWAQVFTKVFTPDVDNADAADLTTRILTDRAAGTDGPVLLGPDDAR